MGTSSSKQDHNTALLLCKDRIHHVKQAIDSRYALSASQVSYLQSLRNVGNALRQFVESETVTEPSLSISEPCNSNYASPSPSPLADQGSPFENSNHNNSNIGYMRATAGSSIKVTAVNLNKTHSIEEELGQSPTFLFPPLPPALIESDSSWDFFDPTHNTIANNGLSKKELTPIVEQNVASSSKMKPGFVSPNGKTEAFSLNKRRAESEREEITGETEEDASDFVTHRAKDMLSSMKEIEHRLTRAAESGHEVSRMLETQKIRLSISSETVGKSPPSQMLYPFLICCKAENTTGTESEQNMKVITWNRSVSSQSSSSRNPLVRDDMAESVGSDFLEEFCMISGSHSSTLDRLYAWERKLYDELKASESIRKLYDQKRTQLRHQFAKDCDARIIDKTRAIVKDLHSRLTVGIQAVDSISRRIEKLRDEELQPQLLEFIQGLIRMWRVMLETYHAQHITVSLAYHQTKENSNGTLTSPQSEPQKQALIHLRSEILCFESSFSNWVNTHKNYVDALYSWLKTCILQPEERSRRRSSTFSPRRALAPPIFVLLRDWSNGIESVASDEVRGSLKGLALDLHEMYKQIKKQPSLEKELNEGDKDKEEEKSEIESQMGLLQMGLVRVFEQLTKFSENMLKVYENVKDECEKARVSYYNHGGIRQK